MESEEFCPPCCGPMVTPAFLHALSTMEASKRSQLHSWLVARLRRFILEYPVPAAPYQWKQITLFEEAWASLLTEVQSQVGAWLSWLGNRELVDQVGSYPDVHLSCVDLDGPINKMFIELAAMSDRGCACPPGLDQCYDRLKREYTSRFLCATDALPWKSPHEYGERGRYLLSLVLCYLCTSLVFDLVANGIPDFASEWKESCKYFLDDGSVTLWHHVQRCESWTCLEHKERPPAYCCEASSDSE